MPQSVLISISTSSPCSQRTSLSIWIFLMSPPTWLFSPSPPHPPPLPQLIYGLHGFLLILQGNTYIQ